MTSSAPTPTYPPPRTIPRHLVLATQHGGHRPAIRSRTRVPTPVRAGFPALPGPVSPWVPGLSLPGQPVLLDGLGIDVDAVRRRARRRRRGASAVVVIRGAVTGTFVVVTTGMPVVAMVAGTRMLGH